MKGPAVCSMKLKMQTVGSFMTKRMSELLRGRGEKKLKLKINAKPNSYLKGWGLLSKKTAKLRRNGCKGEEGEFFLRCFF
jgi:hypothetical protein